MVNAHSAAGLLLFIGILLWATAVALRTRRYVRQEAGLFRAGLITREYIAAFLHMATSCILFGFAIRFVSPVPGSVGQLLLLFAPGLYLIGVWVERYTTLLPREQ